jgi:RNase H-fold protein (predicted Holliday junction resolvase)
MKKSFPKYPRILAIAPSTRGFGFALVEGLNTLVDRGVKNVDADKNTGSLARVKALIAHYEPDVLVLEDASAKPVRRAPRIRELTERIVSMAKRQDVRVMLLPRKQVRRVFFADGQGTKYALAQILAERFPDELGTRLPPKRRPWMSEDSRMDIFGAVALALTVRKVIT